MQWLEVNAHINNEHKSEIYWKVEEQQAQNYVVEKSDDGLRFTAIGNLSSKGDGTNSYRFVEATTLYATGFYRIKQVQKGEHVLYSAIVKLTAFSSTAVAVFPNPVKDMLTVTTGTGLMNTKLILTDISGRIIAGIPIRSGLTNVDMSKLTAGIYILKFENGNAKKILKR